MHCTRDDVLSLYRGGLTVSQISARVYIGTRIFSRPRAARQWVERVIYEDSLPKGKCNNECIRSR